MNIDDFAFAIIALCAVIILAIAIRGWRDRKRGIPPIVGHREEDWQ